MGTNGLASVVYCYGLYLIVMRDIGVLKAAQLEQLRVDPHDDARVHTFFALALDFRRSVVQGIQVVDEDV